MHKPPWRHLMHEPRDVPRPTGFHTGSFQRGLTGLMALQRLIMGCRFTPL